MGDHTAGAGAIPGERAVHHGEDARMDLLLDHEQVHEGFVDDGMGPVAMLVEESAERVLHGAGGGGEDVGLDGGEVDDVFPDEPLGDHEAIRVNLVKAKEFVCDIPHGVTDIDPRLVALVEVDIPQAVGLDHVDLLVFAFPEMGVNDNGAVMAGMDVVGGIAVAPHGADDAFQLPGGGGTAGVEEMPADIDLQGGIGLLGDDILVPGKVHQAVVVFQHRGWRCPENGNFGFIHVQTIQRKFNVSRLEKWNNHIAYHHARNTASPTT